MSLRIRQIVFAASDLEATVAQFASTLGMKVVYRDPQVAAFGLSNALLQVGDQFVEVIAPTRADAAAARHLARHGDSAYMLILQTDDLARDRERLNRLGVRIVWQSTYPDISAVHLHPKDVGAAIVSLDQPIPAASWRWAGPDWQEHVVTDGAQRIVAVTIAASDPAALAHRWAGVLGTDAPRADGGTWRIAITDGVLRFIQSTNDVERIIEYAIEVKTHPSKQVLCGTLFRLCPNPERRP